MRNSILLIRHAQSANNALPEWERVPDPGLTELGQRQAELLASGIGRFPITQLYCSPFRRSLETARPVSVATKLIPNIHAEIYEQGGCYSGWEPDKLQGAPGMNRSELEAAYPGWLICQTIGANGWNHGRNYETEAEVQQRAERVAQWLGTTWIEESPNEMAALVIHADFKRVLLEVLMQTSTWQDSWDPIYNTAITHLQRVRNGWELIEWNSTSHLTDDLKSH